MKRLWFRRILCGALAALPLLLFWQLPPNRPQPKQQTILAQKKFDPPRQKKLKGMARKAASAEWFAAQRIHGLGYIPQDAEIRAVEDMRQRMIPELAARGVALAKSSAGQLNWEYRGPGNVGGRLRGLLVHPDDASILYAGSVSGGVWKSTNAGASWFPTMNDLITLNVSALAMKPGDPNTLYAGTGEAFFNLNYLPGRGLLKTNDGGSTWKRVHVNQGLNTPFITALAVSPANPGVVYAAGRRSYPNTFNPSPETIPEAGINAIFKSMDSGETWQDITTGKGIDTDPNQNGDNIPMDIVVSPADANVVYAAFGLFISGGIWKSSDGGQTWSRLTNGLPDANQPNNGYSRIKLAMAPSDANIVYASFEYINKNGDTVDLKNGAMLGLWKTADAGQSWTRLTTPLTVNQRNRNDGHTTALGSQGRYAHAIIVHPSNPDIVFVGGLDIYKSSDGGNTWSQVSMWIPPGNHENPEGIPYVHADHHVFAFDRSTDPPTLYNGSDGGVARSRDLGVTWETLNHGLGVTQFYYLAAHPTDPEILLGGTQDNGTQMAFAANGEDWIEAVRTGDGWMNHFHVNDPSILYIASYYINMFRVKYDYAQRIITGGEEIGFTGGANGITLEDVAGAEFFAPFEISPNDPDLLLLGSDRLLKSTNRGHSWAALTNRLGSPVVAMAIAEGHDHVIWFANKKARVVKTEDGGNTYVDVTGGNLPDRYLTDIEFDPANTATVYLTYSGYGSPHVFKSTNAGGSWENITNNLPDVPANTIQVHPRQSNLLYLGTDIGVFLSEDGGQTWQPATNGFPTVQVTSIALNTVTNRIFAATHGRGVYSARLADAGTAIMNVEAREIALNVRPGETGTSSFTISNKGDAELSFSITASGPGAGSLANQTAAASLPGAVPANPPRLPKLDLSMLSREKGATPLLRANVETEPAAPPSLHAASASDVLILDDGDDTADDFVGFGPTSTNNFYWTNVFSLPEFGFRLESFDFYMRTESAGSNEAYVAVFDSSGQKLVEGILNLATSTNGRWYSVTINNPLQFNAGLGFSILIGASHVIDWPAGTDVDAMIPHNSYYYDAGSGQYINLNTVPGFGNGAFMIRALGAKLGGANQPPVAKAQISPGSAAVNEQITFDASQSSDPDGEITQYSWDFGDDASSPQKIATHAYARAGNYLIKLKVTDDQGATGETVKLVTISAGASRLAVHPASGAIAPGGKQTIEVTFDAQGLAEGDYQGQISITSNGGDGTLPVRIRVSASETQAMELAYDDGVPTRYYQWHKAGLGSAVRFTPPAPAQLREAKIFIADVSNGNQFNLRVLADANGAPGNTLYGPVPVTAPATGWNTFDLSTANIAVTGDFYVMMEYNGVSKPSFGAEDKLPLARRSWDFNGTNWVLFDVEDYCMRAVVEYATGVAGQESAPAVAEDFELAQNYPNPFNPETIIRYRLPHDSKVTLSVFDLAGRQIALLHSGSQAAGAYSVRWDGRDSAGNRVSSGIYFSHLKATSANGKTAAFTKKMTLMK